MLYPTTLLIYRSITSNTPMCHGKNLLWRLIMLLLQVHLKARSFPEQRLLLKASNSHESSYISMRQQNVDARSLQSYHWQNPFTLKRCSIRKQYDYFTSNHMTQFISQEKKLCVRVGHERPAENQDTSLVHHSGNTTTSVIPINAYRLTYTHPKSLLSAQCSAAAVM